MMESASGYPLIGTALPSSAVVYSTCWLVPSASTISTMVWTAPPAAAVTVTVLLLRGGGGSKVDFGTLSTQVPRNGFGVSADDARLTRVSAAAALTDSSFINATRLLLDM